MPLKNKSDRTTGSCTRPIVVLVSLKATSHNYEHGRGFNQPDWSDVCLCAVEERKLPQAEAGRTSTQTQV